MRLWHAVRNRLRWLLFIVRHLHRVEALPTSVVLGRHVTVHGLGRVRVGERVTIGDDVMLEAAATACIVVGEGCWLSKGVVVSARRSIEIGANSMVGEYTSIRDFDHGIEVGSVPMMRQPMVVAPVRVGSDVWIGRGVGVLKGTTIGDGAVIGANAVVTRDVGALDVVVGVPARVLRKRGAADRP